MEGHPPLSLATPASNLSSLYWAEGYGRRRPCLKLLITLVISLLGPSSVSCQSNFASGVVGTWVALDDTTLDTLSKSYWPTVTMCELAIYPPCWEGDGSCLPLLPLAYKSVLNCPPNLPPSFFLSYHSPSESSQVLQIFTSLIEAIGSPD